MASDGPSAVDEKTGDGNEQHTCRINAGRRGAYLVYPVPVHLEAFFKFYNLFLRGGPQFRGVFSKMMQGAGTSKDATRLCGVRTQRDAHTICTLMSQIYGKYASDASLHVHVHGTCHAQLKVL